LSDWRLFVAAVVPGEVTAALWDRLGEVRRRHPDVRWTPPENWHVTLVFLGASEPALVPAIGEVVEVVAGRYAPLDVVIDGVGGRAEDRVEPVASGDGGGGGRRGADDVGSRERAGGRVHAAGRGRAGEGRRRALARRGGVAWLTLNGDGASELSRLARELDDALPATPGHGRLHSPHLTIARRATRELLTDLSAPDYGFTIDRIALFRSHTGPGGVRYEALLEATLRGSS
jgi:2'-5' RNA ligase